MTRTLLAWLGAVFLALGVALPALAGDDSEGIPVTVQVVDIDGNPIPTAVVRHPKEADRHRVNTFDGKWTASVLYMPDGTELVFDKGITLEFEISAPGYVNQKVEYVVRKRKNLMVVPLTKMDFGSDEQQETEESEDPVIQFGRDKPIDGN